MDQTTLIVVIVICCVLIIALGIIIAFKVSKNKKIRLSEEKANQKVEEAASHLSLCFGGNDNIESVSQKGSRVTILVKDMSLVEKTKIDEELSSVMYMGNKIVFVIGSKSEDFSKLLKENIEKTTK